jgi:NAD(P)H dehydrogenase (quinone)
MMIAITGANGQLGRLVIQHLLNSVPASQIIAAVRNLETARDLSALGVQLRLADYDQPSTLRTAFQGVSKVLLISSSEVGWRVPQHKAVIEAAKHAGVQLLAYTSLLNATRSTLALAGEHLVTEQLLEDSGVPYTLLRNGWYTENYLAAIPVALKYGILSGCAKDGRIASASRADYAAAAAAVLTRDHQAGLVYELAGDEAYTLTELAAEISLQSGKTVIYRDMSEAEYYAQLQQAGLPDGLAHIIADSDTGASEGAFYEDRRQLSQLTGRATQSLKQAVATALKS